MPKNITKVEIQGDLLMIKYTDPDDPAVDEKAVLIRWKKHPKVVKLMQIFSEIVGTYFLTNNKNLDRLEDTEIENIVLKLLEEDKPQELENQDGC